MSRDPPQSPGNGCRFRVSFFGVFIFRIPFVSLSLDSPRASAASNYTGLDNIPFWGVIQTPPSADETFIFMEAIFTPPRLGCKARFSEVFQLAAVQTPVLSSPSSAPGWAVSAKRIVLQQVAEETRVAFERRLERALVPAPQRPDYQDLSNALLVPKGRY